MSTLAFESPAKINLFLAITGRRPDGFHELVSLVAPLAWGDTLEVQSAEDFSLVCTDPGLPVDNSNLVFKAAHAFRAATGSRVGARFTLIKRIPTGAGLGGGSSNAALALRALNQLAGDPLNPGALRDVAASVGSDCALFLEGRPLVMRGRGERIEPLPDIVAKRLSGQPILVFKPAFAISTPWAYRQLAADAPNSYVVREDAESCLAAWATGATNLDQILFNNLEGPAFRKFPALPVLLERLTREFHVPARMSGSGSACFALLKPDSPVEALTTAIRDAWGESAFVLPTRLG
ncbi:MAG: 4-(cytidine 5'-diphospho)-2-C-methyl-D-erythritol kinase [Opitutus sp.]